MHKSIFDPQAQIVNTDFKIIASLERLSEGFRVLLWEKAKVLGISPIQIQMLLFLHFHNEQLCKVSYLAQEFNLTKPTISEAIKSLQQKGFIVRLKDKHDTRSHTIHLTPTGKSLVTQTSEFANPMLNSIANIPGDEKAVLLEQLLGVISHLQQAGIISMPRMCFACRFYKKQENEHYCNFLGKSLNNQDLRIDCSEFEAINS
jgi:DNA-binding MarR family transcriptional regulator